MVCNGKDGCKNDVGLCPSSVVVKQVMYAHDEEIMYFPKKLCYEKKIMVLYKRYDFMKILKVR